jgi:hypothetical protein
VRLLDLPGGQLDVPGPAARCGPCRRVVVDLRLGSWVERGVRGSAQGLPVQAIGGWAPWAGDVEVIVRRTWWGRPGCLEVANTGRLSGYENSVAGQVPGWVVAVAIAKESTPGEHVPWVSPVRVGSSGWQVARGAVGAVVAASETSWSSTQP